MRSIKLVMLCIALSLSSAAVGQKVALKTNLIGDALLNPNLGIELGIAPKWSLDVPASFNAWNLSHDRKWKHWYVQPGVRYWFCDRMAGHFVGMHLHGGQYNIGGWDGHVKFLNTDFRRLKDSRFQGWFAGAGISYGYSWILGKHWNIEAEIGFGWAYSRYDRFECAGCGRKVESDRVHNYVGPTKGAINMVYVF